MKLYSIRNKQTGIFNPPFVARDHIDAEETVRKAIVSGRDISLLVELDNLDLHCIGDFDAKTAEFVGYYEKFKDLSDIPLPDHLNKMIAKLKEVKE